VCVSERDEVRVWGGVSVCERVGWGDEWVDGWANGWMDPDTAVSYGTEPKRKLAEVQFDIYCFSDNRANGAYPTR